MSYTEITKATSAHCQLASSRRLQEAGVLLVSVKGGQPDLVAQVEICNGSPVWGLLLSGSVQNTVPTISFTSRVGMIIVMPIFQIGKVRHRELEWFSEVTQPGCARDEA